ncbi:MAG: hypothetical protein ABJA67_08920 [Chthonomonadales bacterium]
MTVTTANLIAVFKAGDLVRLYNRITKQDYIHTTVVQPALLDMAMLNPPRARYITQAGWHKGNAQGRNEEAAQIQFNDLTRAIWMNVMVDETTQDIIVQIWGEAIREGVTGLHWGLRGIDLTAGKFILPARGGISVDVKSAPEKLQLHYPGEWEAQMAIWQGAGGGFVIYSRDERVRCKQFVLTRKGSYADLALVTEAQAPFEKAGGVPQLEWRLNTYKGDWRTPAQGYRRLMQFYRPLAPATKDREWVKSIRAGVVVEAAAMNKSTLDKLAEKCDPAKTILYLPDWRKLPGETGFPDLQARDGVAEFTEAAHQQGFRIAARADLLSISTSSDTYNRLKAYQTRDSVTGKLTGNKWQAEMDPERYAILNPAARDVQNWVSRLAEQVVRDLHADMIYIPHSGDLVNDGSNLVENKTFAEGMVTLHRRLMTDYPGVVIANDMTNEMLSPYSFFGVRSPGSMPQHRISSYLFGDHVLPILFDSATVPKSVPGSATPWEAQGIYPTVHLRTTGDLDSSDSEANKMLALVRIWQNKDLRPDYGPSDEFTIFQWFGKDNTLVDVREKAGVITMMIGETIIYSRTIPSKAVATQGLR